MTNIVLFRRVDEYVTLPHVAVQVVFCSLIVLLKLYAKKVFEVFLFKIETIKSAVPTHNYPIELNQSNLK